MNPVADIPELNYVKFFLLQIPGIDIDYSRPPDEEEKLQTATITVLATPEQAMLLTRYENEGVLHVALISREMTHWLKNCWIAKARPWMNYMAPWVMRDAAGGFLKRGKAKG